VKCSSADDGKLWHLGGQTADVLTVGTCSVLQIGIRDGDMARFPSKIC
jgi:hypothetical protein